MTKEPKEIIGVRKDKEGDITHVKFSGSAKVTPLEQAVAMAKRGGYPTTTLSTVKPKISSQ